MDNTIPKLGTDNIEKIIDFGCGLTKSIHDAGADGWQLTDALKFWDDIRKIPGVVKALPQAKGELRDLDATEKQDLVDKFKLKFDLANDKAEALIENAFELAITVLAMVDQWATAKN